VEAASEDAEDVKIAADVREQTRKPAFGEAVDELLDALGKGYSVVEMMWDRGAVWTPGYKWRDPRFFQFDDKDGTTLRLMDESHPQGLPLPPYKFIVHLPKLKSGIPIRGGLARLAAASYMCKSFTLKDWMAFAEIFGLPLRIGRHKPGALKKDIETLIKAVANIGTDAAAVLPDNMRIEFVEAAKSAGGEKLFRGLAEWLDRQVSKAVLGQVASTEGTPGKLGGDDAQEEVRQDIKKADAKALATTVNRDMVKPYVDINYGKREKYPRVLFPVPEPEDLKALSEALEKLVPLGVKASASWARKKFNIPEPKEGEELLEAPAPAPVPAVAENHRTATAMNRSRPEADMLEEMADAEAEEWEPVMAPIVNPVLALAGQAESFEEFLAELPRLLEEMNPDELINKLARATFKARGMGDATDG
jgi:phage gp29-like protein